MPRKQIRNVVTVDFNLSAGKDGELGSIVQWQRKVSKTSWQRSKACNKCRNVVFISTLMRCIARANSSLSNIPSQSVSANFQTFPSTWNPVAIKCLKDIIFTFQHGTLFGRWDFIISSLAARPSKKYFSIAEVIKLDLTSNFSLVLFQAVENLVVLWLVLCHHPSSS